MSDANTVVMSGRLTSDPVSKKVGEYDVCTFRMASNDGSKEKEKTVFIEVEAWAGNAKSVQSFKKKGDQVIVTGKLRQNQWEKDGQKQSKTFIEAKEVSFIGAPSGGEGGSEAPVPKTPATTSTKLSGVPPKKAAAPVVDDKPDDLPF